jgi:hypothetical protein
MVLKQYSYPKVVKGFVECFDLIIKNNKLIEVEPSSQLTEGNSSQDKWGCKNRKFSAS